MSYKIFVVDTFKKELKKLAKKYKNIKEDYLLLLQTLSQEENKTITLLSIYSKSDYENISEELIDKKIVEAIHKEQL